MDVDAETAPQARVVGLVRNDREIDDAVGNRRRDRNDGSPEFGIPGFDDSFRPDGQFFTVLVSYFAVDLEAGQVGNDRDLGSLGYLRSDLPVNEGQGRFSRRQYPGVFQQTCFLFERFLKVYQFHFFHADFGSGVLVFVFDLLFQ